MELYDRIPERELMDDDEQARAYAHADFAEAHEAVVDALDTHLGEPSGGAVADLGCGPGDVSLRYLARHPGVTCVGIDGSEPMLEHARAAALGAGLDDRLSFEARVLPDPTLAGRGFAAVISNSLLHHLADPSVLWHTIADCAVPGAAFAICDLMRPGSTDVAAELVDRYAPGEPDVLRADFYNSLLAAFRPGEIETQLAEVGFENCEVEPFSDRHLVAWGRTPV